VFQFKITSTFQTFGLDMAMPNTSPKINKDRTH